MIKNPSFYSVIIGSEILNGRRVDSHFKFFNDELLKRGYEHTASFIIVDNPPLIKSTFEMIAKDPNAVMFSFGGIGATPDDYTRECAADVFTNSKTETNQKAKEMILDRFKDDAYPHRINMATLPLNSSLLPNPISNVPGFYLEDRFFFVPGFPSMAHPMIIDILDKLYIGQKPKIRLSLLALCSENSVVNIMKEIPSDIDLSSLPKIEGDKRTTSISIASYDDKEANKWFDYFKQELDKLNIEYILNTK